MQPFALPITLALSLAGCGVADAAASDPPDTPSDEDDVTPKPPKGQHFCCADVKRKDGSRLGSDCESIGHDAVKACTVAGGAVLFCAGSWDQNTGGTVTCE